MAVLVQNVNGSSRWGCPSGYNSWLDYWEKQTGRKAYYCAATDCYNSKNLVGAHVRKVYGDNSVYIVPLCQSCNQRTGSFYVNEELVPVPSRLY